MRFDRESLARLRGAFIAHFAFSHAHGHRGRGPQQAARGAHLARHPLRRRLRHRDARHRQGRRTGDPRADAAARLQQRHHHADRRAEGRQGQGRRRQEAEEVLAGTHLRRRRGHRATIPDVDGDERRGRAQHADHARGTPPVGQARRRRHDVLPADEPRALQRIAVHARTGRAGTAGGDHRIRRAHALLHHRGSDRPAAQGRRDTGSPSSACSPTASSPARTRRSSAFATPTWTSTSRCTRCCCASGIARR